jgi:hypothetical protein
VAFTLSAESLQVYIVYRVITSFAKEMLAFDRLMCHCEQLRVGHERGLNPQVSLSCGVDI